MWSSAEKKRFDGPASEDETEQSFAIPHSLSAGSGTLLLAGIPEKRRAQPPQSLHLQGLEREPAMERLSVRIPSAESIGACSLDVDASESSSSARPMAKEASEITLRSMVVSTRESSLQVRGTLDVNVAHLSNGCWNVGGNTLEPLSTKVTEHRPSYLGISCAVNGYTSYSQFCRSRDSSPARLSPRSSAPLATSPSNRLKVEPILEARAGGHELPNGRHHGPQEMAAGACTSLVQQRIAALYGSEAAERVARSRTRTAKTPLKLESAISKRSPSCPAQVVRGRSKSPPVFRHLTRDFKEHLRLSEVSASPAENLPGFVIGRRLLGSPEKRLPFPGPLHIREVDRGDSSALKTEILEESRNCQVVNGGGAPKINGNHGLPAAVDEVDKAVELPDQTVTALQPQSLLTPASVKALSSSDLPAREGHSFLDTTLSTQNALESRIREAELDLNDAAVSEDMKGRIRAAIGKANLLINQKFKQFRELCLKNIEQNLGDPFPTTGSDLAGFWDMVMLQVENVNALFEELNMLKANDWVEPESTKMAVPRPVKKAASRSMPASPKRSEKAEEAAKSRLEARKRLMEAKRQARQNQQQPQSQAVTCDEDVSIFLPQEKSN